MLADTAGATPCNAACRLLAATGTSARVRLLGGVNLPMLLRALCYQHEALEQLVARALEGGRRAIVEIDALAAASATTGCAQHPSCPESNC